MSTATCENFGICNLYRELRSKFQEVRLLVCCWKHYDFKSYQFAGGKKKLSLMTIEKWFAKPWIPMFSF